MGIYTPEEMEKAETLARDLKAKLIKYVPRECTDAEKQEVKLLQKQLQDMGFMVTWSGVLDHKTGEFPFELTLWVPKRI